MFYDKNKVYIGILVAGIIIVGLLYTRVRETPTGYIANGDETTFVFHTEPTNNIKPLYEQEAKLHEEKTLETFRVFISGEVVNPNVYEVKSDARVIDLLEMAGGATAYADLNQINLAAFLTDAQHVIIPKIGNEQVITEETGQQLQQANVTNYNSDLININTATQHELMTLPGIGTVIAQNIIDYREEHGYFNSIEEIQRVNRIGPSTFEGIKNRITV